MGPINPEPFRVGIFRFLNSIPYNSGSFHRWELGHEIGIFTLARRSWALIFKQRMGEKHVLDHRTSCRDARRSGETGSDQESHARFSIRPVFPTVELNPFSNLADFYHSWRWSRRNSHIQLLRDL